jgi:hypothetical protein
MKQRLLCLALVVGASLLARWNGSAAPPCQVEQTQYRGWKVFRMSNGLVTLYIAPDIGGRVIQYELGAHPYFFVNPDLAGKVFPPEENGGEKGGWKNYGGSKLWPAPQGWERDDQWPGPPDPILDGGRYQGEITRNEPGQVTASVTSPPDPRTGIQFTRTISLSAGSTQVQLECTMRNISARPVGWSIWEVTQLDTADPQVPGGWNHDFWAYCPLNPRSVHPKGYYPMFGQVTHPSFQPDPANGLLQVRYDHRVGKVGLDSNAGWLAAVNNQTQHAFIGKFMHVPNAPYPDHASVEFWLNGAGEFIINGLAITNAPDPKETPYLMEAEILSPLANLAPGETYRFRIDWFATRCPKPVLDVTPAGVVCQRPTLTRDGARWRLTGVFGVFVRGQAEAVCLARDGRQLSRVDLGPVRPDEVVRIAREVTVPADTYRVSVRVADEAGLPRGTLAGVNVALP